MQLSSCSTAGPAALGTHRRRYLLHTQRRGPGDSELRQGTGCHAAPSKHNSPTSFFLGFLNPNKRKTNKQAADEQEADDGSSDQPHKGTPRQASKTLPSPKPSRISKRNMLRLEENMAMDAAEPAVSSNNPRPGTPARASSPAPRIRRTPRAQRDVEDDEAPPAPSRAPPSKQPEDTEVIVRAGSEEGSFKPAGSQDLGTSVSIDLTQIKPAPVTPRRPTPSATRSGSPSKSRSQGRSGKSPAPSRRRPYSSGSPGAEDIPSAKTVKQLEPGLTALQPEGSTDDWQGGGVGASPKPRRSLSPSRRETLAAEDDAAGPVGQLKRFFTPLLSRGSPDEPGNGRDVVGTLMDMVQRNSPMGSRVARPRSPSPAQPSRGVAPSSRAGAASPTAGRGTAVGEVQLGRPGSPSLARRMTSLRSVEETAPVRPLASVEEKGPVRQLHSVEEIGPVNLAARAASPAPARSPGPAAADARKPRSAPLPSRRSTSTERDDALAVASARAAPLTSDAPAKSVTVTAAVTTTPQAATAADPKSASLVQSMARASGGVVNSIKQFLRTPGLARPTSTDSKGSTTSTTTVTPTNDKAGSQDKAGAATAKSAAVVEVEVEQKRSVSGVRKQSKYSADQLIPGDDPYTYDYPEEGPSWTVLSSKPFHGGTLEIMRWEGRRMIRVWLPPGYDEVGVELMGGLPSVWMHDGQNLFDPALCLSGTTWKAAETAAQLINTGKLPPFVIIGVDHPGLARPYEYTPYKPGTGPTAPISGGFRSDAATWPGGGVWDYLDALVNEVVPRLSEMYDLSRKSVDRVMGGASFGGIATLCAAMRYPTIWGGSLVESPSLWIAEEDFLRDIAQHKGLLPSRVFLGMGGKEFSGVRPAAAAEEHPEADGIVKGYATKLSEILHTKGLLDGWSLKCEVQEDTTHNETAWAGRFGSALTHLGSHWWHKVLKGRHGKLFTISPYPLRPGAHAVILVNRERSTVLSGCESIRFHHGYNMSWEIAAPDIELQPAEWRLNEMDLLAEAGDDLPANFSKDWWVGDFEVPETAYELHFALSGTPDKEGLMEREWENNNGANYYYRLARPRSTSPASPDADGVAGGNGNGAAGGVSDAQAALDNMQIKGIQEQIAANAQALADQNCFNRYFLVPETLVAGAPAMVYFNKRCDHNFAGVSHLKLCYGWNGWDKRFVENGAIKVDFRNSGLLQTPHLEWWCAPLNVPEDAVELNFAFTNGDWLWDSNNGYNYSASILPPASEVEAEAEAEAKAASSSDSSSGSDGDDATAATGAAGGVVVRRPREVARVEESQHGAGTMHVVHLQKRPTDDPGYSKSTRWIDEKIIRVWTPPGWNLAFPPAGGWPVLYLSDGQNLFEDKLAHQGVAWRVGYQSSDLISKGELPPYIVVGIDSAGPMRSLNYLPYTPGSGVGGFRNDAARWPGGGVADYMTRVTQEIMPVVEAKFGASTDPSRVAFGGGSFGGVCALYTAMHYPHLFGGILAESPSLWIAEGRFLQDMAAYKGQLPERIFLACGTREFSATRPQERHDVDALLLDYCNQAAKILDDKGCRPGQGRLLYQIEEGAGHHEGAWQWRFSGAMRYLWSHLWDITPRHALNE